MISEGRLPLLVLVLLFFPGSGPGKALGAGEPAQAAVEVGSPAPELCLPASGGGSICLKDYRGKKNVVLLFYVLDFTRG